MSGRFGAAAARDPERGTVVILVALLLTALVGSAAIVIDLGALRGNARQDQSIADFAALAAGKNLTTNPVEGCQSAVVYINANAKLSAAIDPTTFCAAMATTTCTGGTTTQATPSATVGSYIVSVHYPVPDNEIADPRIVGGARLDDGTPCQRIRVLVTSGQHALFSGIFGYGNLSATRSATARPWPSKNNKTPSMWLLDPTGCTSLSVSGGSQVATGTSAVPGVITVDSDGSACSSNQVTVSSSGAGSVLSAVSTSTTPGEIDLYALPPTATTCTGNACSASDVTGGRLVPQPVSATSRATRALVDDVYDCHAVDPYSPYHGITLSSGCDPSTTSAYIDELKTAVGTSGAPQGFFGGGAAYQQWSPANSCNTHVGITLVTGNWWVNCPGGLTIGNGSNVEFANGNVVFDGSVKMTGGTLSFNVVPNLGPLPTQCLTDVCIGQSDANASLVYLRSGDIDITGGVFTASHTLVYSASGYVKVNSSPPVWLAPTEGPFNYLSLWSDMPANSASVGKFAMAGGVGVQLSGVFFTPEAAPFKLSGGGSWGQQNAQFIAYQLVVTGGGSFIMAPDPAKALKAATLAGTLIR